MIDSGQPSHPPHNRNRSKALKPPKVRQFRDIEVRFVYEGELKGSWFSMAEAIDRNLPVLPNPDFRVIRAELRDLNDL